MKKLFAVVVFALASHVGFAQQVDETFKKDVLKLIELQEGGDDEMAKVSEKVPEEKRAAFVVELNAFMDSYKSKLANVYMEVYTKEDLKELITFYESPFWKKLSDKKAELTSKSKDINMELMMGLMPIMMKYAKD